MKYLCLCYYNPETFERLAEAEQEAIASECQPYDAALRQSGHLVAMASLQHRTAAALQPRNGQTTVTDGPFAETKEVIGSFFIIEAENLDEATRVASMSPAAKCGEHVGFAIEVRPIETFEDL